MMSAILNFPDRAALDKTRPAVQKMDDFFRSAEQMMKTVGGNLQRVEELVWAATAGVDVYAPRHKNNKLHVRVSQVTDLFVDTGLVVKQPVPECEMVWVWDKLPGGRFVCQAELNEMVPTATEVNDDQRAEKKTIQVEVPSFPVGAYFFRVRTASLACDVGESCGYVIFHAPVMFKSVKEAE